VAPALLAVAMWIAYYLIAPKPPLFGDSGIFRFTRDLLVMGVPFMIGALATVAMGSPGSYLDRRPAGAELYLDGEAQSEKDILKKRALDQLTRDLRKFAANFLRIISGSGKPLDLLRQTEKLTASLQAYADAHDGALPTPKTVHQILDSRAAVIEYRPWIKEVHEASRRRWEKDGTYVRNDAVAGIIKAGLRMVASELVDQLTQRGTNESEFYEQIRRLDDVRKKSRRRHNPKK
jgi:hypothetical protein